MYKILIISILFLISECQLAKIDPALLSKIRNEKVNIFLSFNNTESILEILARSYPKDVDIGTSIYFALKNNTERSQRDTINFLSHAQNQMDFSFKSFWINNKLYINGADYDLALNLASRNEVSKIEEEDEIVMDMDPTIENEHGRSKRDLDPPDGWGLDLMQVSEAWEESGTRGEGVVVGMFYTGVRHTHEALADNYIGGDYGWYDSEYKRDLPYDTYGWGTHSAGVAVGGKGVGVAPGSKWMACRGLYGDTSAADCFQFFACPHQADGSNPDCSKRPDIVLSPWYVRNDDSTEHNESIEVWRRIGIIPIFTAGTRGPRCVTVPYPGNYWNVLSVTTIDAEGNLPYNSSAGPSKQGRLKPELTGPGIKVRSALTISSDTEYGYIYNDYTSAPSYVAGVVALMKSIKPSLEFNEIRAILQRTASKNITNQRGESCHNIPDQIFPNYHYGYGIVNALNAVRAVK